ncbi:MAG: NAD(+) kinase [Blastocatellia bacterium]
MEIKTCVLVIKRSAIVESGRAARLANRGDVTARRLVHAHDEHRRTADHVRQSLKALGVEFSEVPAHKFKPSEKRMLADADLVIGVGGDATVLNSSHFVRDGVMLGVNSAPKDSVGHFCFARRGDFKRVLGRILRGDTRPKRLARLAVSLDGRQLPELALNDVLIAHKCPAATTRYIIRVGGASEEHRSSGVWISTAAGSTAGILSAGGRAMSQGSRRMQYLIRELYRERGRNYKLTRGLLGEGDKIVVASKMPEGELYLDGSRTRYLFRFGARAAVRLAESDLKIFL